MKKKTEHQKWYQSIFDALMAVALENPQLTKKQLKEFDDIADFIGDIAHGRKNVGEL